MVKGGWSDASHPCPGSSRQTRAHHVGCRHRRRSWLSTSPNGWGKQHARGPRTVRDATAALMQRREASDDEALRLSAHAEIPDLLPRVGRPRWQRIVGATAVAAAMLLAFASPAGAAPAPTDVMFVFDTSGSMEPVLEEAKAEIGAVVERLRATLPNPEFGVAEVKDTGEEEAGIFAWRLAQPVTPEASAVTGAISTLRPRGEETARKPTGGRCMRPTPTRA